MDLFFWPGIFMCPCRENLGHGILARTQAIIEGPRALAPGPAGGRLPQRHGPAKQPHPLARRASA